MPPPTAPAQPRRQPDVRPSWARTLGFAAALLVVAAVAVAIWLRNRDILRDLYDYSSVIVAAGKIEAGLKPYVDFRSTMQSATYALNWGVERIAGANYLALTWGGLTLTLAGLATLAWLWRPVFGVPGATALAGAVALAGLSQHVVIFYNPLGLLGVAIVAAGLSREPRLWPLRSPANWAVVVALVLGGTNKLNFHVYAVAIAGLLLARAWIAGELPHRAAAGSLAVLMLAAIATPLGLELWWTGASLRDWAANVILLPYERVGYVTEVFSRDIYRQPAHDLHHHIVFKPLTAAGLVGIGLAMALALPAAARAGRSAARRIALTVLLLTGGAGLALGGVMLTITNVESVALTSLGLVIGAATLWAGFAGRAGEAGARIGRVLLPAGSLLWTAVGGFAAWHGSRVLFGPVDPVRESFVRLEHAPRPLAYLEGVRLDAGLHQSLLLTARELEHLQSERGNLSTVLFGPAMEWLERAYPEAILRGMPVWYHHGTALTREDGPWLRERLASHRVDRIILHPSWESWPGDFQDHLRRDFRRVDLGPVVRIYEQRQPDPAPAVQTVARDIRPLRFCELTGSNIQILTTRTAADMNLHGSPWGDFYGRSGSSAWEWLEPVRVMEGSFTARLLNNGRPQVTAAWRVVAHDADRAEVLYRSVATLTPEQPEIRMPFRVAPGGRTLTFEIEVDAADTNHVAAGWRDMRITHAGPAEETPPPASLVEDCPALPPGAEIAETWFRKAITPGESQRGWQVAPFEAWKVRPDSATNWGVTVQIERMAAKDGTFPVLALVWYKAGRLELLSQKTVVTDSGTTVQLDGWMPEPGGWIGVFVRPADATQDLNSQVRVLSWSL